MSEQRPLSTQRLRELRTIYRDGLLDDTLPFWLPRSMDHEHGGFLLMRDRDGSLLDTDKGMWHQARFTWLLATLAADVEPREEWIDAARHGLEFIRRYGFADDGRMYFHVTRDGRPIRTRRYAFTEMFTIAALAAYARAAGDEGAREQSVGMYRSLEARLADPTASPAKFHPQTRPAKGLAELMIMITTAQEVRACVDDPEVYTDAVTRRIREIESDFVKRDRRVVLETAAPDGSLVDHVDERTITPGHSIEAAWFILREAAYRDNDPRLIELGTQMLDWMWEWGWDREYGGILYFRDATGRPVQEYWHDMKFWWPHNETVIASLWAYELTGERRFAEMHAQVHEWAYAHFPDPEHGEWFGYLHRDGTVANPAKGNLWKGPFHLPRMQLTAWQITDRLLAR